MPEHLVGLLPEERDGPLNPLGAVMAVNLLAALVLISITGIMMEIGDNDAVEEVHVLLSDYAMLCVVLHIIGALIQSKRSKSKLVKAMITGRKEINDPSS